MSFEDREVKSVELREDRIFSLFYSHNYYICDFFQIDSFKCTPKTIFNQYKVKYF